MQLLLPLLAVQTFLALLIVAAIGVHAKPVPWTLNPSLLPQVCLTAIINPSWVPELIDACTHACEIDVLFILQPTRRPKDADGMEGFMKYAHFP